MFSFSIGNGKLGRSTGIFNLPAAWTCPGASICKWRADRITGKLSGGEDQELRCFAASEENHRPNVRASRWKNLDNCKRLLASGGSKLLADHLIADMPAKIEYLRIHASGDFFSREYLRAWILVAQSLPDVTFYAYTKSIPFFVGIDLPNNFIVTASIGGKYDDQIPDGMKTARIVYSEAEAEQLGLPIDHDDSHARENKGNFALLIHGVQPAGSMAAKAISELRKRGEYGYGPAAEKRRKSLPTI